MHISDILPRLKGVRRTGPGKWMALCCSHQDSNRSLSIREIDGRVLLYCFGGCSYESLASSLGIEQDRSPKSPIPFRSKPTREAKPEFSALFRRWSGATDFHHLDGFAMSLGVDTDALKSIGCAWNGQAWAFPMKDAVGEVIGIRLRSNEGQKWAVTGSRSGLFIPTSSSESTIFICEGPTDAAAGLMIGLYTIGRPSCQGQEEIILEFIRRNQIRRAVIITDNDSPGLRGAAKLRGMLRIPSCQWVTPLKDLREFVQCGGQKADVESSISSLVWKVA